MANILNISDLLTRLTGGNNGNPQAMWWTKQARVAGAAAQATVSGRWTDLWQYEGNPAHGAVPAAFTATSNATNGALKQASPGSGREQWLVGGVAAPSQAGLLLLYDRLMHKGGLDGTSVASQTVQGGGDAITRYTDGVGNEIWIYISTAIGATLRNLTVTYDDQDGNTGITTVVQIGGTGLNEAQRLISVPLASGDYGVRKVTSVQLDVSTGTAGDFAVILAHPLALIPCQQGAVGEVANWLTGDPAGGIKVQSGACIVPAIFPNGTTAPDLFLGLQLVEA